MVSCACVARADFSSADKSKVTIDEPDNVDDLDRPDKAEKLQVSHLVKQYLEAQNLGILPPENMEKAVEDYVEKGNKSALSECVPLASSLWRVLG